MSLHCDFWRRGRLVRLSLDHCRNCLCGIMKPACYYCVLLWQHDFVLRFLSLCYSCFCFNLWSHRVFKSLGIVHRFNEQHFLGEASQSVSSMDNSISYLVFLIALPAEVVAEGGLHLCRSARTGFSMSVSVIIFTDHKIKVLLQIQKKIV